MAICGPLAAFARYFDRARSDRWPDPEPVVEDCGGGPVRRVARAAGAGARRGSRAGRRARARRGPRRWRGPGCGVMAREPDVVDRPGLGRRRRDARGVVRRDQHAGEALRNRSAATPDPFGGPGAAGDHRVRGAEHTFTSERIGPPRPVQPVVVAIEDVGAGEGGAGGQQLASRAEVGRGLEQGDARRQGGQRGRIEAAVAARESSAPPGPRPARAGPSSTPGQLAEARWDRGERDHQHGARRLSEGTGRSSTAPRAAPAASSATAGRRSGAWSSPCWGSPSQSSRKKTSSSGLSKASAIRKASSSVGA